ncbi:MAG: GAF domain-containing protein, partial [Chromatiales bacterium]|nr:GAF domain-containing protein [Chromatiales bacterium]
MSPIAQNVESGRIAAQTDELTLASVEVGMRLKLHLIAAVAVVFLSVYGRVVCPFVDSVQLSHLVAGLCAVGLAQICLREALYGVFPRAWGSASLARHGMYLAVISWVIAGLIAVTLHMVLYPGFPIGSHVKLLTGYWALGGGILSQLEFNMLERYLRRHWGTAAAGERSVESMTGRLMESYAVFTIVPAMILVLAIFRQVHEGYGTVGEALEVTFLGVVFVGAALTVAWRYGAALREDCRSIRGALGDVETGHFLVQLDASRTDDLGLVARGISDMGQGLALREQRESKLLEITSAFAEQLHLDRLLAVITIGATKLLSAERSTLYLHDAARDQLWTPVAEGVGVEGIFLATDAGLAGACFRSQSTINLEDVQSDPRFSPEMDRHTGFVTRNMLAIPVNTREGKHLGVIQVLNRRDGPFDERDEQRLRAVAAQAATAIENAQLFEDVLNLKNYDE